MSNRLYEETVLKHRLNMYRNFCKSNPQMLSISSLVTILMILSYVWSLIQLIEWFNKIDTELLVEYANKQYGYSETVFSYELVEYIKCLKKQT